MTATDELRDTIVGIVRTVEAIGDGTFVAWNKKDGRFYTYTPSDFCHVQPDSWERIIRDARAVEGCGSIGEFMERHGAELVERCKRLAGDA